MPAASEILRSFSSQSSARACFSAVASVPSSSKRERSACCSGVFLAMLSQRRGADCPALAHLGKRPLADLRRFLGHGRKIIDNICMDLPLEPHASLVQAADEGPRCAWACEYVAAVVAAIGHVGSRHRRILGEVGEPWDNATPAQHGIQSLRLPKIRVVGFGVRDSGHDPFCTLRDGAARIRQSVRAPFHADCGRPRAGRRNTVKSQDLTSLLNSESDKLPYCQ